MSIHPDFPYQLYLVISQEACGERDVLEVAEQAILGGVDIVQLREKNCSLPSFTEKAMRLKEMTDRYQIPLIINDNLEVAMAVDAAGIHVGNNDLSPVEISKRWLNRQKIIGYSIEYLEQLSNEQTVIANHLGISPVFSTPTKTDTVTQWGLEGLRRIRQLTEKPLIAIGNMQLANVKSVIEAGANSIAVVSAICGAKHPEKAAYELKNEIIK